MIKANEWKIDHEWKPTLFKIIDHLFYCRSIYCARRSFAMSVAGRILCCAANNVNCNEIERRKNSLIFDI